VCAAKSRCRPAWQGWLLSPVNTRRRIGSRPSVHLPPSLAAGFTHAAFVFGCEGSVAKAGINGKEVPVGALVSFIQKVW
jgi:hypothetical protein